MLFRSLYVLRHFVVFNADQVDGADEFHVTEDETSEFPSFAPADELITATGATIQHGGGKAFYTVPFPEDDWPHHVSGDYIQMPLKQHFDPASGYYETLLHELAHWSERRLGWDRRIHGHAMCELVAEIAASYLASELGVPQADSLENHAAYVKSWLWSMRSDPSFIFSASTQASKVADFLLSFVQSEAEKTHATTID